jgi:hypothetical protein
MMRLSLLPFTVFLAFVAGAFLFEWEKLPPFTSLAVAVAVVLLSLLFPDKPK